MPMCRAASTSGHDGHADEVGAERAQHADLGRSLEGGAEPGGVHALAEVEAEPAGSLPRRSAQLGVVRVRHVRKARPEALVVRAHERRLPLEVDVVGDEHELSRLEAGRRSRRPRS